MLVSTDILSFCILPVYRSPQHFPVSGQGKLIETLHPDFAIKSSLEFRVYLNTHLVRVPPWEVMLLASRGTLKSKGHFSEVVVYTS